MTAFTLVGPGRVEARKASRTEAMIDIAADLCHPTRILIAGCGSGVPAGMFARTFDAQAIGIDVGRSAGVDFECSAPATLIDMDVCDLHFPDEHFDFVCSANALERAADPVAALRELSRVLAPGGHFLIGTSNRDHLVGSVAAVAPRIDRLRHHLRDWSLRLRRRAQDDGDGRAGFTETELLGLVHETLGDARSMSDAYYAHRYRPSLVMTLRAAHLTRVVYPSVYVAGRKR